MGALEPGPHVGPRPRAAGGKDVGMARGPMAQGQLPDGGEQVAVPARDVAVERVVLEDAGMAVPREAARDLHDIVEPLVDEAEPHPLEPGDSSHRGGECREHVVQVLGLAERAGHFAHGAKLLLLPAGLVGVDDAADEAGQERAGGHQKVHLLPREAAGEWAADDGHVGTAFVGGEQTRHVTGREPGLKGESLDDEPVLYLKPGEHPGGCSGQGAPDDPVALLLDLVRGRRLGGPQLREVGVGRLDDVRLFGSERPAHDLAGLEDVSECRPAGPRADHGKAC